MEPSDVAEELMGQFRVYDIPGDGSVLLINGDRRVVIDPHPRGRYEIKDIDDCTCEVVHGMGELKGALL